MELIIEERLIKVECQVLALQRTIEKFLTRSGISKTERDWFEWHHDQIYYQFLRVFASRSDNDQLRAAILEEVAHHKQKCEREGIEMLRE